MTAVKYPQPSWPHQMDVMSVCQSWLLAVMSNGLPCAFGCGFLPVRRNPQAFSSRAVFLRFST